MCHFYWTQATRAIRRQVWTARFLVPFLAVACMYFTIVTILEPYWIMMSSAEFVIVQLFCVAGFYITHRLNEIRTLESVRTSQKCDLSCVVIVFEVSALFGFMYDLTLKLKTHSGVIFCHIPLFMVMLLVFQPLPDVTELDDITPVINDALNSGFSKTDDVYGQLYQPSDNYSVFVHDTLTYPSLVYGSLDPSLRSLNIVIVNAVKKLSKLETVMEESGSHVQTPEIQSPGSTACYARK